MMEIHNHLTIGAHVRRTGKKIGRGIYDLFCDEYLCDWRDGIAFFGAGALTVMLFFLIIGRV